jgi:hypothetical protein
MGWLEAYRRVCLVSVGEVAGLRYEVLIVGCSVLVSLNCIPASALSILIPVSQPGAAVLDG